MYLLLSVIKHVFIVHLINENNQGLTIKTDYLDNIKNIIQGTSNL